jgi:hypothetical protein
MGWLLLGIAIVVFVGAIWIMSALADLFEAVRNRSQAFFDAKRNQKIEDRTRQLEDRTRQLIERNQDIIDDHLARIRHEGELSGTFRSEHKTV